jgi:hypothetical protein
MSEPRRTLRVIVPALGALFALGPAVVGAEPTAEPPAGPTIFLELFGRSPESRGTAYDESLKTSGPAPRGPVGVPQPDGSVRYGNVSVYVKEVCPEGASLEVPPLPGRRRPTAH